MKYHIIRKQKIDHQLNLLAKRDKQTFLKVSKTINKLSENPYRNSSNILGGKCPGCRRVHAGKYRIIYYIYEKESKIAILDIIPRKQNYRHY